MALTLGSLFAGIGGFDLGFERAGFQIRWQVEIDDYCTRVLAKHWPNVERFRDVRDCGRDTLAAVDVLCGGFPCQPHSLAGRRRGAEDERNLWPEFARLIRELEPRWVVAENVPGLLSTEAGRFFGTVLGDLAACGYDAEWDCLPAAAFGAPHRRDRLWLVAYPMRAGRQQITGSASGDESADEGRAALHRDVVAGGGKDVADPDKSRLEGRHSDSVRACAVEWPARAGDSSVADTESGTRQREASRQTGHVALGGEDMAHTYGGHSNGRGGNVQMGRVWRTGETPRYDDLAGTQWRVEPDVGRVAHGVSARVDRLKGLGNAIVPQIAQWIAERIVIAETR